MNRCFLVSLHQPAHPSVWCSCCLLMTHSQFPHGLVSADPLPDSAPELVKQAVREKWAIYTLRSGLQSLPLALLSSLEERGVKVHLGMPCTAIHFRDQSAQVAGLLCLCTNLFYLYRWCVETQCWRLTMLYQPFLHMVRVYSH